MNRTTETTKEAKDLVYLYSKTKLKIGLTLAEKLLYIESKKLYLKIDRKGFPTFNKYLESLGLSFGSIRELLGLYKTYIIVGGYSVEELSQISFSKLSVIKSLLFKKENNEYKLIKSKKEMDNWVKELKSDISINDLKIRKNEEKAGNHECEWEEVKFKKCKHCKIKTYA
ncbi:MAG: hypothetical protein WD512_06260 [Candidatus Paceibacterota bacterium]